jgi:hypothetical protein
MEDGDRITFVEKSQFLECQVCQQARLRVILWNSENEDSHITFHPPASLHKAPPWLKELPPKYRDIALQIYPTLDAGNFSLALMGARSLLDIYISGHTTVKNDFKKKLDDLCDQRVLTKPHAEMLFTTFDAGSAAAHRDYHPSESSVLTAVQVVEHLIHQDVLEPKAQKLKAETPQRQR